MRSTFPRTSRQAASRSCEFRPICRCGPIEPKPQRAIDPAPACDVLLSKRKKALVKRVAQLLFELEQCEMEARAYRVSLHFPLHCHLLPYHHLFLHCHFLLNHGLAFCCENVAGPGMLRRQRLDGLDRRGSPDISFGDRDVQPGMGCRGR